MRGVKSFAGHRDAQVNCIAAANAEHGGAGAASFSFASCDSRGFVATWDVRAPRRMAQCALPFVHTMEVVDIMEIVMVGARQTLAVSDGHVALIDWRNPKVPVWHLSAAQLPASSDDDNGISAALWRPDAGRGRDRESMSKADTGGDADATDGDVLILRDGGDAIIVDSATGRVVTSAPAAYQSRDEVQLPCGVAAVSSSSASGTTSGRSAVASRCAIIATTLGHVSVVDTRTWTVIGSARLGGMKDDEDAPVEQRSTNPPFLSSIDCVVSLVDDDGGAGPRGGDDGDDDDAGNDDERGRHRRRAGGSVAPVKAVAARADGIVVFAHVHPTAFPAVTRLVDLTVFDLSQQLCSANWMCSAFTGETSNNRFAVVAANGVVTLWSASASALSPVPRSDGDDDGDEEERDADFDALASCELRNSKLAFNDAQADAATDAIMNCACVLAADAEPTTLLVGDSVGRIMCVDFAAL